MIMGGVAWSRMISEVYETDGTSISLPPNRMRQPSRRSATWIDRPSRANSPLVPYGDRRRSGWILSSPPTFEAGAASSASHPAAKMQRQVLEVLGSDFVHLGFYHRAAA
jgi:hypothetical protein